MGTSKSPRATRQHVTGAAVGHDLESYLRETLESEASDLHLTVGLPPMVRVDGEMRALEHPKLTPEATRALIHGVLTAPLRERLEEDWELDFGHSLPGVARFRVNAYFQRGVLGSAWRVIPREIRGLEELGLPEVTLAMTEKRRGLILVTGPTGSGKSTTLAAMIDRINESRREHIISIEDPIEFLHRHKGCVVNQREIGQDTRSYAHALKHALRQDPDVILVGELRDLETISPAVTAAETGHLVFATLHTRDAPQTIDRIVDVFPPHQQHQIRAQLANALQGIVVQTLIPRSDGKGRVAACEILIPTPGVRNLMREGKSHQIYSAMQTGGGVGMQTMDAALVDLVRRGLVSRGEAERRSDHPEEVRRLAREPFTPASPRGLAARRS